MTGIARLRPTTRRFATTRRTRRRSATVAVLYFQGGEVDRALAAFNETLRIDPKDIRTLANRGEAYGSKGDIDRALADYNEVIRLSNELLSRNPRDRDALHSRADAYNGKGEPDRAIADATEAIRLSGREGYGYTIRGIAYALKGDHAQALKEFETALSLSPTIHDAIKGREKARGKLAEAAQGGPAGFALSAAPAVAARANPIDKESRVALIIGNSQYQNVSRLANPTRDAELLAETLRRVGFEGADR